MNAGQTINNALEAAIRVPSYYLIERRDWESAADFSLDGHYPDVNPEVWEQNPWTLVVSYFMNTAARAILNYPYEDVAAAAAAVEEANRTLVENPAWTYYQLAYWRFSFDQCVKSAEAWRDFSHDKTAGIEAMQAVNNWQASTWYPEIGHYWDSNEQLAEMYLLRNNEGDVELALEAYEKAIEVYPNRYHSLAGAGQCAEHLGDETKADFYYSSLLILTSAPFPSVQLEGLEPSGCPVPSPSRRPEIVQAEEYLHPSVSQPDDGSSNGIDSNVLIFIIIGLSVLLILSMLAVAKLAGGGKSMYSKYDKGGLTAPLKEKLSDEYT